MMKSLTKRQEEILLYIISDFQKTSRLPSISDIAREFSFNKRAAYEAVDALIKKECLKKTEKGELLLSDDYRKHLINIKIPSFNNVDKQCYVMLKDAEEGECFSYTVSTDEMRNIGIMPGDECIFLSCTSAKSGDIDVTVTNVILRKGPQTAPLVLADNVINGTSHYYSSANGSEILIGTGSEAGLQEGEPATIAETMLLPNPYGSSDPDSFNASDSNYADKGEEKF